MDYQVRENKQHYEVAAGPLHFDNDAPLHYAETQKALHFMIEDET